MLTEDLTGMPAKSLLNILSMLTAVWIERMTHNVMHNCKMQMLLKYTL